MPTCCEAKIIWMTSWSTQNQLLRTEDIIPCKAEKLKYVDALSNQPMGSNVTNLIIIGRGVC